MPIFAKKLEQQEEDLQHRVSRLAAAKSALFAAGVALAIGADWTYNHGSSHRAWLVFLIGAILCAVFFIAAHCTQSVRRRELAQIREELERVRKRNKRIGHVVGTAGAAASLISKLFGGP